MSHTKEWYEEYAEKNSLKLGPKADRVIEMVDKNNGYCPCKVALVKALHPELLEAIVCPCQDHMKEIEATGHCHCTLFYKKEE